MTLGVNHFNESTSAESINMHTQYEFFQKSTKARAEIARNANEDHLKYSCHKELLAIYSLWLLYVDIWPV